ncbi:hypothetical protein GU833_15555 [Photorhabdus akhurstii]
MPDKNAFVKNLGLLETVARAKSAYPKSGGVVNGNVDATGYVSGKGVYEAPGIRVYSSINKPSPEELGAFPTIHDDVVVVDNTKFSDVRKTGIYIVGIYNPNSVADLPTYNGAKIYSYGFLVVFRANAQRIHQTYYSHIGDIATRQTWDGPEQYQPWIIQYSTKNKPSAKDLGTFPGVVSVASIPTRSFIGPFSGERTAGWAKGINIGQSGDVGQIYITPEGELYTYFFNSNGAVEGGIVNTHPVGVPIPWPLPNVPAGYFSCNGQSFNKSIYPKLATAYPSGVLPDLRGEFIRGWDDSRGVDPGRVCGSWQGDAFASHKHGYRDRYYIENVGSLSRVNNKEATPAGYNSNAGSGGTDRDNNTFLYIDSTTAEAGNNETRPRNIAFNYIVRAA